MLVLETLDMRCTGRKVQGSRKAQGEMAASVNLWGVGHREGSPQREQTVRNQVESLEPPVSPKLHVKEEAADRVGGLAQGPRTGPRK